MTRALVGLFALSVSACAITDPYLRPGAWQPEGANAGNIAAQLERPTDLHRGRATGRPLPVEAQLAVARIYEGRERPLGHGAAAEAGPAASAGSMPGAH